MRTTMILITISCLATSCASRPPLPEPRDCAAIGAAFGAVGGGAGAAEHAEDHDDGEAAGIGIASVIVGAALGYGICALLQREKPAPRPAPVSAPPVPEPPKPKPTPPPVVRQYVPENVCEVSAVLQGVNFATDSSAINSRSERVLAEVAENLKECPEKRIRIEAHTDWVGTDVYNVLLSQRRARSVRNHLIGQGIAPTRLDSIGFGEGRPTAENTTSEGRAKNRRVEIHPLK